LCGWRKPDADANANARDTNAYAGNTDANAGNTDANAGDTYTYADTHGDPTSADAKAAAHTVSSTDAVSEWVKE